MDYILELLGNYFQDEGQRRLVFLALIAAAIFIFGLALSMLVASLTDPVRRRLAHIVEPHHAPTEHHDTTQDKIAHFIEPVSKFVLPKKEWERSHISSKLVHAGYRHPNALMTFYAIKTLLAIVLPFIVLFSSRFFPELSTTQIFIFMVIAAFIGVIIPNTILEHRVKARKKLLRVAFPDALDLLVICVESGLGLVAALQRVAKDLDVSHPHLAEELALVNTEVRLGVPRMDALKNMAHRTGLEEIDSLVVLIDQSVRFGTSVAEGLRIYSEEFRDKRTQAAEEAAAKIGTKMIFPLVLFLWPSFFLVAIGPAVIRMIEAFSRIQ